MSGDGLTARECERRRSSFPNFLSYLRRGVIPPETTRRQQAIEVVEKSRETHVEWRDFLIANPDYPTRDVGDIGHHQSCINGYDLVLAELRGQ